MGKKPKCENPFLTFEGGKYAHQGRKSKHGVVKNETRRKARKLSDARVFLYKKIFPTINWSSRMLVCDSCRLYAERALRKARENGLFGERNDEDDKQDIGDSPEDVDDVDDEVKSCSENDDEENVQFDDDEVEVQVPLEADDIHEGPRTKRPKISPAPIQKKAPLCILCRNAPCIGKVSEETFRSLDDVPPRLRKHYIRTTEILTSLFGVSESVVERYLQAIPSPPFCRGCEKDASLIISRQAERNQLEEQVLLLQKELLSKLKNLDETVTKLDRIMGRIKWHDEDIDEKDFWKLCTSVGGVKEDKGILKLRKHLNLPRKMKSERRYWRINLPSSVTEKLPGDFLIPITLQEDHEADFCVPTQEDHRIDDDNYSDDLNDGRLESTREEFDVDLMDNDDTAENTNKRKRKPLFDRTMQYSDEESDSNPNSEDDDEDWIESFSKDKLSGSNRKQGFQRITELEPSFDFALISGDIHLSQLVEERYKKAVFYQKYLPAFEESPVQEEESEQERRKVYQGIPFAENKGISFSCLVEGCDFSAEIEIPNHPKAVVAAEARIKRHAHEDHLGGFKCLKCPSRNKIYNTHQRFLTHIKAHLPNAKLDFRCEICGKPFRGLKQSSILKVDYPYHLWSHKSEDEKAAAIVAGESEPKMPTSIARYKKLSRSVEKLERQLCPDCGKSVRKDSFKNHCKSMHSNQLGEEKLACPHCGKLVKSSKLDSHIWYNHDNAVRLHGCKYCDRSFKLKSGLTMHIQTKHMEPNFICNSCGKAFHTKLNLKLHEQIHLDREERIKFTCQFCGKGFVRKENLKRHENTLHKEAEFC